MNNDKETIIEKLEFFLKNKIKIHITKTNREFLNGFLVKKISSDVFVINEVVRGELHVFASEIFNIEEYMKKEEERK